MNPDNKICVIVLHGRYLRDVLTRLPTLTNRQIKNVTPEAWAKAKLIDNQQKAA